MLDKFLIFGNAENEIFSHSFVLFDLETEILFEISLETVNSSFTEDKCSASRLKQSPSAQRILD